MKKLAVTMVTIAMLAVGCISASAVESPEVPTNVAANSSSNADAGKSTTSAKTGVSGSCAIFAALGVIACGGVATVAKRKLSE